MKKLLIILFVLNISYVFAQNEFTFKVHYNPETNYNQSIQQNSETNIRYIGSEEVMQKLKEKGIQNPTLTNSKSTNNLILKTGKLSKIKSFPLTIEFAKTISNEVKKTIPDGTIIYGSGTIDNLPKLDSIVSENLNESFKKTLLETMQSTFSQLSFP